MKTLADKLFRPLVAGTFRKLYGVRGGIKPPLKIPGPPWLHSLKVWVWEKLDRAYSWSRLPEEWNRWMRSAL